MRYIAFCLLVFSLHSLWLCASAFATSSEENEYLGMDITQLMEVTITSVSKKPQTLSEAPAAIYVITAEDIKKSGVTSIPEVLRMVPGLQVARITSSKWGIASRGLNGFFSNKLLVLMDGRTLYSPAFSGTYWDNQHTLLEDIERIEVIRGPGATMWGANAVNGVINIITRNTSATKGGYAEVGAGVEDRVLGGVRYGAALSNNTSGRVYAAYNNRDSSSIYQDGGDAYDGWENLTAGFRLDGTPGSSDTWTFHGDLNIQDEDQIVYPFFSPDPPYVSSDYGGVDSSGWNLLGKWEHSLSSDSTFHIQAYYDYFDREDSYVGQTHRTVDVEMQYDTWLGKRNNLTMGIAYRNIDSSFEQSFMVTINPNKMDLNLYSGFLQDVITLVEESLWLTLGSKWEHNDFTGDHFQPTARLMFRPNEQNALWTSVSKAVRTPSQFERNGSIKAFYDPELPEELSVISIIGSDGFGNEEVVAYEAGYRWFPSKQFSVDLSLFYNEYEDLLGGANAEDLVYAGGEVLVNSIDGNSYGLELAAKWQPTGWLDVTFTYAYLKLDMEETNPESSPVQAAIYGGSSPRHQASLQASMDIARNWQANAWLRYVGELECTSHVSDLIGTVIDEYTELDLNLSWKPVEGLEVMFVGQNLLDSGHLEFISEFLTVPTEVERSAYIKLIYHF